MPHQIITMKMKIWNSDWYLLSCRWHDRTKWLPPQELNSEQRLSNTHSFREFIFHKTIFIFFLVFFYTRLHVSGRKLWFHVGCLCVFLFVCRPSVCPSVFCFQMITSVNISGLWPNFVCALILWRSGLGFLMGKFCQIFDRIIWPLYYFHFRRIWRITWVNFNGLSQNLVWALILWRSGLGLQMGTFHQLLKELSAHHTIMAGYYHFVVVVFCCFFCFFFGFVNFFSTFFNVSDKFYGETTYLIYICNCKYLDMVYYVSTPH